MSLHTVAGRIDEVDRVDAIAAASLRVIEHVVEDRQAAEVGVFPDFVRRVAQLRNVEASDRRGRSGRLRDQRLDLRRQDLRAGSDDDAVRLGIAAVAGVAGRIDQIRPVLFRIAARPLLPL